MKLSLREQLEQAAQRPAVYPPVSGSPVTLRLEVPFGHRLPNRIPIVQMIAQQGSMRTPDAFDIMMRLLHECQVTETLRGVADVDRLIEDLAKADVTATVVEPALAE